MVSWRKKLKSLYKQYKDNWNCSHLIAEALDLDGKVSSVQVSNKLKHLGLKVPSKKRMLRANGTHSGSPAQLREGGSLLESEITLLNLSNFDESSTMRQPLHTRKRVRAFSEDQEMKIKTLFELFKNHKRCSYKIANALDADGTFTAAQISRKLKQLGLLVPRRRSSEANMHLRDEDFNDYSTNVAQNSDNESLLALKHRNKNKRNSRLSSEEVPKQKIDGKLLEDDSDDQLLSSVLENSRRHLPKTKSEKLTATSIQQSVIENESGNGVTQDVRERDGREQANDMEAADVALSNAGLDGNFEATGISREKQLGVALVSSVDHSTHQQLYDELADELEDSGDDVAPIASPKNALIRRKLRMVIDLEDD